MPRFVPTAPLILALVGATLSACASREPAQEVNRVPYDCADGMHFIATYYPSAGRADLETDGEMRTLSLQTSGSGFRYGDGRTTLIGKGEAAFIEVNGSATYRNCIARKS